MDQIPHTRHGNSSWKPRLPSAFANSTTESKLPKPCRDSLTLVGGDWCEQIEADQYQKLFANLGGTMAHWATRSSLLVTSSLLTGLAAAVAGADSVRELGTWFSKTAWGQKLSDCTDSIAASSQELGKKSGRVVGALASALGLPVKEGMLNSAAGLNSLCGVKPVGTVDEIEEFLSQLQLGDIILTREELSPVTSLTYVLTGHSDFTHAIIYAGESRGIEAVSAGVKSSDLKQVLQVKQHAVALRPDYQDGQAQAVVKAAEQKIGSAYDFLFAKNNEAYYCSELAFDCLAEAAPQIKLKSRELFGQTIIVPDDIFDSQDTGMVVEFGRHRSLLDRMSHYAFAPSET